MPSHRLGMVEVYMITTLVIYAGALLLIISPLAGLTLLGAGLIFDGYDAHGVPG